MKSGRKSELEAGNFRHAAAWWVGEQEGQEIQGEWEGGAAPGGRRPPHFIACSEPGACSVR